MSVYFVVTENGKPVARWGRKATDLLEVAELPKSYASWQLFFFAALGSVLTLLIAGPAGAEGTSFRDDFTAFDSDRWIKSSHTLGRTDFDPANVSVGNGYLRERIPANTTGGAEVESMEYYGYGIYRARIMTADAPSSITGFYLYRSPDLYAEIDIEIYNDGTGDVDFVTYADGRRTHHTQKRLTFDPSAAFHNYRFDYNPGSVKFYVDGELMAVYTDGLPNDSMKLLVNTWFPSWLPGTAPTATRYTRVDWIDYQQR
jgi:beta-glucanase (GH16 family)